jgi:hypothetical protein
MNRSFPSDAEIAALAEQVDEQLISLRSQSINQVPSRGITSHEHMDFPPAPKQAAIIERMTGEPLETFWPRFKRHLGDDLCHPGGLLYEKWKKWRDLPSRDSVKVTISVLTGMGIATDAIPTLAVATTVFLLNVLTKVGIETICDGRAAIDTAHD